MQQFNITCSALRGRFPQYLVEDTICPGNYCGWLFFQVSENTDTSRSYRNHCCLIYLCSQVATGTSARFYTGNTIAGAKLQAPVYTHQREAHLLKSICLCAKHSEIAIVMTPSPVHA